MVLELFVKLPWRVPHPHLTYADIGCRYGEEWEEHVEGMEKRRRVCVHLVWTADVVVLRKDPREHLSTWLKIGGGEGGER